MTPLDRLSQSSPLLGVRDGVYGYSSSPDYRSPLSSSTLAHRCLCHRPRWFWVLNGMWQTSSGWGRIERDDVVEAMLRYSDSSLSTFDMVDHCLGADLEKLGRTLELNRKP